MVDLNKVVEKDGYLVDGETGEKVIFYECDQNKNVECPKDFCRALMSKEDEAEFGFCSKTPNPAYRKDGGRAFYAILKENTYWGREYIDE